MFKKIECMLSKDARELEQKKVDLNHLGQRVQRDVPGAVKKYQETLTEAAEIETRLIRRRWIVGVSTFATAAFVFIIGVLVTGE